MEEWAEHLRCVRSRSLDPKEELENAGPLNINAHDEGGHLQGGSGGQGFSLPRGRKQEKRNFG